MSWIIAVGFMFFIVFFFFFVFQSRAQGVLERIAGTMIAIAIGILACVATIRMGLLLHVL